MLVGRISLSRILFDAKRGFWTGGDHPPALLATPPVVRGSESMMLQLSRKMSNHVISKSHSSL